MKATRNLAIAVVMLAMVAATSLVSVPAFADTIEESGVPDAPATDSSGSGGSDNGSATDANGAGGSAAEPGDAATGSLTVGAPTTLTVGENAPAATEPGVLAGGVGEGDGNGTDNGEPAVIDGESGSKGTGSGSYSAVKGGPADGNNAYEDGGDGFDGNSTNVGSEEDKSIDGKKASGAGDGLENGGKAGDNGELGDGTEKKVGEEQLGAETKRMLGASGDDLETDQEEPLVSKNESASEVALGPFDEVEIAKNLAEGALYGIASGSTSWAAKNLVISIFGDAAESYDEKMLDEIMSKLDEIEDDIKKIDSKLTTQQLQDIFNNLQDLFNDPTTYTIYSALRDYDDDLADALRKAKTDEDRQKAYDDARTSRLSALTDAVNITDYKAINTPYDQYVDHLWTAMTVPKDVTFEDGQKARCTLMQLYYELMRRTYKWEHQAYDDWASFQAKSVSLLMSSLALNNASLQARIDQLDPKEAAPVIERQQVITDRIKQASGYKVVTTDGPVTIYPGFYSEETWASQYWMFKKRDESERYYWVPQHEILFYAQVNTQHVPQETKNAGLSHNTGKLKGIVDDGNGHPQPRFSFWQPFVRYQGGDTLLASKEQLQTIYKDYGSSKHLYDIFIGEDEGNFQGLDIDGNKTWWFVIDPDKDHPLEYCPHLFKADRLRCYVLSSASASVDTAILCYYHNDSTESDGYTHYIGVGVKRVGPETYNPGGNGSSEAVPSSSEIYTAVRYTDEWAIWWPSYGDLLIGLDDAHGNVEGLILDGKELDPSSYTASDGKIALSQALLADLGYGKHELYLDTEGGGHTLTFFTRADGVYYMKSGDGSTWAPGAGDGLTFVFKRTEDDATTFSHLVDVLVDGVSVPAWGYTARAGSAIITLTDAFLSTLAPGIHILTAVFDDGNNPSATFTVLGGATLPASVTYAAAPAHQEQTPRTGDGAVLFVMLLAAVVVTSSCIAYQARKRAQAR